MGEHIRSKFRTFFGRIIQTEFIKSYQTLFLALERTQGTFHYGSDRFSIVFTAHLILFLKISSCVTTFFFCKWHICSCEGGLVLSSPPLNKTDIGLNR